MNEIKAFTAKYGEGIITGLVYQDGSLITPHCGGSIKLPLHERPEFILEDFVRHIQAQEETITQPNLFEKESCHNKTAGCPAIQDSDTRRLLKNPKPTASHSELVSESSHFQTLKRVQGDVRAVFPQPVRRDFRRGNGGAELVTQKTRECTPPRQTERVSLAVIAPELIPAPSPFPADPIVAFAAKSCWTDEDKSWIGADSIMSLPFVSHS